MKLENSIQDNKTIQNLKFNSQFKMVRSGLGWLRGSQARRVGCFLCRARPPAPLAPPSLPALCLQSSLPAVCLSACLA